LINYKSLNKTTKCFINELIKNCPDNQITARTEWVNLFLKKEGVILQFKSAKFIRLNQPKLARITA
jgi:hypothetical protein